MARSLLNLTQAIICAKMLCAAMQAINSSFYLLPNAQILFERCQWFSSVASFSAFIRWQVSEFPIAFIHAGPRDATMANVQSLCAPL